MNPGANKSDEWSEMEFNSVARVNNPVHSGTRKRYPFPFMVTIPIRLSSEK